MIPKKNQVLERARALFYEQAYRSGMRNVNTPEDSELLEGGFYQTAKSELMRDQAKAECAEWQSYNEKLEKSESFSVNVEQLFESNALILGSRHTGKSDLAMLIANKCRKKDSIVVCFDPSLDWLNRSSISTFQTLTIPLITVIPTKSMIYDISLLSPRECQQVVESFSEKLFRQQAETPNRKKYLVVFEESHTYFPQGCMRAKAYQNTVKLLSVGRNLDISCLLISQFASMVDKFAVKHSISQAWCGFTKEFNDMKYLRSLLGSNVEQLTKLNDGEFLYLTRDNLQKIRIEPYQCDTAKTEIKPKIPEPQLMTIPQQNSKSLISVMTLLIGLLFLALALSNVPKGVI